MTTTNDIITPEVEVNEIESNEVLLWRKVATLAIAEYHNQALCEFNDKDQIVLATGQNDIFAAHDEFSEDDEGELDIPNYMYFKSEYFRRVCDLAMLDYDEVIEMVRERV